MASSGASHMAGAPALSLRPKAEDVEHAAFETFSKFNRDRSTWIGVSDAVLWELAAGALGTGRTGLRCWSCGCSSGEEAYYLRMIWQRRLAPVFSELDLTVIGTDLCEEKVEAARRGAYPQHSVQGMPAEWQLDFFEVPESFDIMHASWKFTNALLGPAPEAGASAKREKKQLEKIDRLRAAATLTSLPGSKKSAAMAGPAYFTLQDAGVRESCSFVVQDVTTDMPEGPFDVICSRYAVCLYLEAEQKSEVLAAMVSRLRPGGFLILGNKDKLPNGFCEQHGLAQLVYRTVTEACPFGPPELVDGIFRKGSDGRRKVAECVIRDEPRLHAGSYREFMQSTGGDADWVEERERLFRERTQKKMTEKSRAILDKAEKEGRRECSGGLLDRMTHDFEARRERAQQRETAKQAADKEIAAQLNTNLTREAAASKITSFFDRLGKDIAQREELLVAKQREQDKQDRLLHRCSSNGTLKGKRGRRKKSSGAAKGKRSSTSVPTKRLLS